jgi:hypothetical protein
MGRLLISAGLLLVVTGLVVVIAQRIGIGLGRLPGDIRIEGKGGGFYFPIVTCILISVVATIISWFFRSR